MTVNPAPSARCPLAVCLDLDVGGQCQGPSLHLISPAHPTSWLPSWTSGPNLMLGTYDKVLKNSIMGGY